jgi:hypothetical protein
MTKEDMRQELDVILATLDAVLGRLRVIRAELHNRPPTTRGECTSAPVDEELVALVLKLHADNPSMPQHDIAELAGTNQGRVSEILAGKRT